MPTAGKTLKLERLRAEVTATALAARMGLSRQSLWVLERSATVDSDRVRRYREALAGPRDVTEASEGAA